MITIQIWFGLTIFRKDFSVDRSEKSFLNLVESPKSDCIHHFPIDLESNGIPFDVTNQSENGKDNLISV